MDCIRLKAESLTQRVEEDWGSLTWLASKTLLHSDGLTLGRVIIKRGMSNPRHSHPNSEEILYLLEGRLEHTIEDKKVLLEKGDTLRIKAGVVHNALSIGDLDADMIVVYPTPDRKIIYEA